MSKKKAMFFKQTAEGVVDLYDFDDVASLQNETASLTVDASSSGTGWYNFGDKHTITASDTVGEFYDGNGNTRGLKAVLKLDTNFLRFDLDMLRFGSISEILAGDSFTVSFWAKTGVNVNAQQLSGWTNCTGSPSNVSLTATWTKYEYTITAETTADISLRFYGSWVGGVAGDELYLDDFSIIKI